MSASNILKLTLLEPVNGSQFIKSFKNIYDSWNIESIWLRFMIQHIRVSYITILYDDNVEYIASTKGRYIKGLVIKIKWQFNKPIHKIIAKYNI